MRHLKQTNIDINKYENSNIKQVHNSTFVKGETDDNKQGDGTRKFQSSLSDIPLEKIVLFIVIATLLFAIAFMINGIINR